MKNIKKEIKRHLDLAIAYERYDIARRLCENMETAIHYKMETKADFGGDWAGIECDFEAINEIHRRDVEDACDDAELFEAEKLSKLDYEV